MNKPLQDKQRKIEKIKQCKHEPSGMVCLVAHADHKQCSKCKKCGEWY